MIALQAADRLTKRRTIGTGSTKASDDQPSFSVSNKGKNNNLKVDHFVD